MSLLVMSLLQGVRHRQGGVCCVWGVIGPPRQPFLVGCYLVKSGGLSTTRTGAVKWNTDGDDGTDKNNNLCVAILIAIISSLQLILLEILEITSGH